MDFLDKQGVAARLRTILGPASAAELAVMLGVDESGLRQSLDEASPDPTVEVLVAVATKLAVDPAWILTGDYNPVTHRQAAETAADATRAVQSLVDRQRRSGVLKAL